MKILFLNTDLGYGGAEKMLAFLANSLADAGMEVTFLTYRENSNYQKLNILVKRDHIQLESGGGNVLSGINTISRLRKYIKSGGFDLAIAFLTPSQLRLVPACWNTKTKVLVSQRADPFLKKKSIIGRIVGKINDLVFCNANFFVFQTDTAKSYYPAKVQLNSCVIPNPVKPLVRTIERTPQTIEKRIVSVARLELKQKRQDLIIDAFNILSIEYPDYQLEFYGTGEDLERISRLSEGNECIKICGLTRDVAGALQNAKMFVLASDYEGIPNALMEAMSIGVPCVSTDCSPGGAALLIDNSVNGLLVQRNNPEKLYGAMKYLIEHPESAEQMALKAKLICESFSEIEIANKWIYFISNIIK